MTNEQINAAIAEACGWTVVAVTAPDRGSLTPRLLGENSSGSRRILPNYVGSLDAMHEAVSTLAGMALARYGDELQNIVSYWVVGVTPGDYWADLRRLAMIANATTRQRAEAFLRCLGKWEDAQ